MIDIELTNEKNYPVNKKLFLRSAAALSKREKKLHGIVETVIVDNRIMRKMNKEWRGTDRTTDVLSFAWTETESFPGKEKAPLGQIFISYPRIIAQAKECGVSVKEELKRMFLHGLLHLIGYDHVRAEDAKKMFSLQEKIILLIK
jgi:probable rRNA maturation factor